MATFFFTWWTLNSFPLSPPSHQIFVFWYGANVTPCSDKHGPRLTPVCPVRLWALSPRCHVHTVLLEWTLLALLLATLSSGLNAEQIWTLHLPLPKPGQGPELWVTSCLVATILLALMLANFIFFFLLVWENLEVNYHCLYTTFINLGKGKAWTLIAIWRVDYQRSSKASLTVSKLMVCFLFRLWTNTFYSIYFKVTLLK